MHIIRAVAAVVAVAASSPALADEFYAVTPSGATEMVFAQPPKDVVGTISAKCIDAGWSVVSSSDTEVVCEAPLNFGQSVLGQLALGNSYSTPPRRFFKYNAATVAGISRVQASGWMEVQMAFGQVRRTDFSGPEFHNSAMVFLGSAGGKYPVGTTFPNHAYFGGDTEGEMNGKYVNLRVTKVDPESPAGKAGVQVGDVITTIAGKRFKDTDDLLDATARAAKSPFYPMEVLRGGQTVKVNMPRLFRPEANEAVTPVVAASSVASMPVANVSVADELGKLGKLKADGLITQEEFDAQKAKLLAR
jgi:hypothetical protein